MEMLQDITESLLNQMHIPFRKRQVGWLLVSHRYLSSYRMQGILKFVITVLIGCGKSCLGNICDLILDDIAWLYAPHRQRSSYTGSYSYSFV